MIDIFLFITFAALTCPSLTDPPYGSYGSGGHTVGSRRKLTCTDGFQVEGIADRLCLPKRQWEGTPPACKGEVQVFFFFFSVEARNFRTLCTRWERCENTRSTHIPTLDKEHSSWDTSGDVWFLISANTKLAQVRMRSHAHFGKA